MANKNAKNTMNGTDVFVVAPSNMGKGLAYNETVKQYEVNAQDANGVKLNPDGTVGVALSKDGGNLLELRKDGIYYGNTAPEELRHLHVSSVSGNDSNNGTKESPLRTIQAAVDLLKDAPYRYYIWLKAGETFEWVNKEFDYTILTIGVYGAEASYPYNVPSNVYYRGHLAKSFPRPVVRVQTKRWNDVMRRHSLVAKELTLLGIKFEIDNATQNDDFNLSGHYAGFVNRLDGKTELQGCVINIVGKATYGAGAGVYRNDSLTRCKTLTLLHCHTDTGINPFNDNTNFAYAYINPSVQYSESNGNGYLQGNGQAPDYEVYPTLDFVRSLNLQNIAYNFAYDTNTKSLFGINVNFDIFQNS